MRFKITGDWKEGFEQDGMLYCAQRIEEMLMPFTSHLYKVPVFNTFLLAYEYSRVYTKVENKTIDHSHLKNVLEEFIDSFTTDIVVKELFSQKQIEYYVGKLTGSARAEQYRTMDYLTHVMATYPRLSLLTLCNAIKQPKEKKRIEKALRSFLPMVIGMGYDPHYIQRECIHALSNTQIDNVSELICFLESFDGSGHDFTVFFVVDKKFEAFKPILLTRLDILYNRDLVPERLKYNPKKQLCFNTSIRALDANGAASLAYNKFNLFMSYYRFLGNRDEELYMEKCIVVDEKRRYYDSLFGTEKFSYSKDYDNGTLGRASEGIISELFENSERNDFEKINKIIKAHNTALSCKSINSAFLNLWSILEIVCIDGRDENNSKIKRILSGIIPVLQRNYINDLAEELHDYLKANLSQEDYSRLLSEVEEMGDERHKIVFLISLKKYGGLRKKVCECLKQYPLLRSRICQLYEDVFKHKTDYIEELKRYGKRLGWHIQRLYRVRNQIIHSGESDENIVPLVEHLHSYVDEVVFDIIERMTRKGLGSVDNVLIDSQVFMDTVSKELMTREEFTDLDLEKLMQ